MMKLLKLLLSDLLISVLLTVSCYAQIVPSSGTIAGDEDGTNRGFYKELKFANGNTTNNGDGSISVADQTGAGGGDPVLVNTVAVGDAAGVDFTSGTYVTVTLNAGVSPDTATFEAVPDTIAGAISEGAYANSSVVSADIKDGTIVVADLGIVANIPGMPRHIYKTIIDPLSVQTEDNEICLVPAIDAAITVTKIVVTLDAAANEVAGDLKYADTFIGLANPVVINAFDTTSGVLSDASITAGAVGAGKTIYIQFDSQPSANISQMGICIEFDYD